jgi:NAD-dependent SIR2 family protein deacetylase
MSIKVFEHDRVQGVVERFGKAQRMAVFVGAGASVEAGLPTWETLIERLLRRAASVEGLFEDPSHCREWIESTLRVESLAGAASIAEGLLTDQFPEVLREVLFDDTDYDTLDGGKPVEVRTADDYQPGQIAYQVAFLREAFDNEHRALEIFTTNYDDLLEMALAENKTLVSQYRIYPYVGPYDIPKNEALIEVRHLHGFLGRKNETCGPLTLTERSFLSNDPSSQWQHNEVVSQLGHSPCLFLGTSLTDLNIVRYIYEHQGTERHAVVFVRQAEMYDVPEHVRAVRERVAIQRWGSEKMDVIFVDHYSDVAQLLHEIAKCRSTDPSATYRSLPVRKLEYMEPLEANALSPSTADASVFRNRQTRLNESLSAVLAETCETMKGHELDLSTEDGLALGLWLIDSADDKEVLTAWATTDRVHTVLSGLHSVPLDPETRWVSVRAFCAGQYVGLAPDPANSRWSYIVGVPLWTKNDGAFGRIPIGALTVTTQTHDSTKLADIEPSKQRTFARALAEGTLTRLERLREG